MRLAAAHCRGRGIQAPRAGLHCELTRRHDTDQQVLLRVAEQVTADTLVIATGAVAKKLDFPGSGEGHGGFWNKGISACAVCDGAAPMFRKAPLAVIGGGDTAMEESQFLTRYGSKVCCCSTRLSQSLCQHQPPLRYPQPTLSHHATAIHLACADS